MKHRTCSSSSRPRVLLRCQMTHTPVSSLIRGRPQTRAEHLVGGDHNNSHAAKKGCRYGRRLSIAGIALTQGLRLVASPPACATSGVDEVSAIRSVLLVRDTLERDDAVLSELTEILRVALPAVASLAVELRNAQRRSPLEFLATGAFGLLDRQMDGASETTRQIGKSLLPTWSTSSRWRLSRSKLLTRAPPTTQRAAKHPLTPFSTNCQEPSWIVNTFFSLIVNLRLLLLLLVYHTFASPHPSRAVHLSHQAIHRPNNFQLCCALYDCGMITPKPPRSRL